MEAKKVRNQAAQGDILLRRVKSIPKSARKVEPVGGRHIVAHSETGHHHYLAAAGVELFQDPGNPLIAYLRLAGPATLVHGRETDTHAPLALGGGARPSRPAHFEVRRQREYTPAGWQRVED